MPADRARVRRRLVGTLACLALLGGCAGVPQRAHVQPVADAAFRAEGRLSARHGSDAVSANFVWNHAPPHDELSLVTPLGQTVAQLTGDTATPFARVTSSDGRVLEAADWKSLTERALGFPLPVSGLAAWIRGAPHPKSSFDAETDPQGRTSLLRQDGWEIGFDYPDDRATAPSRLRLVYPDVEVRLVVDRRE